MCSRPVLLSSIRVVLRLGAVLTAASLVVCCHAEGTVGIGGSYMCIYPMDSPGGYQLVGRTLPIWNTFARAGPFTSDKPWLLEYFDQVGGQVYFGRQLNDVNMQ